ncbi:Oxaloacetate decarboxylase, gamma chain [Peptoclostridium litorale DSM 5388]|uniref:Oxaloacetate decarboxylase gamma chain n=1 Tax=Peptoclostridium litorale DSM 5388 TaxID=1121324 RepID=A0A069RFG3_PEPLI|nr:OadG family protein [Peptoclostridium litorale]KDR95774.1 hypothetical protein CLIT_10c05010 [Peptoclostridium litorale DSM 5388]SIO21595.1 Oxaloacetate decarboxylase, gamma chain [Peptoclostridium litorale DSM 5388]
MLGESVTLTQALKVTGLSMTVVFVALFVICQILELFGVIFYKRGLNKKSEKISEQPAAQSKCEESGKAGYVDILNPQSDEDLAAVAVASILFSDNSGKRNVRIKSIRRLG